MKKVEAETMNEYGPDYLVHGEKEKFALNEILNLIEKKKNDILQQNMQAKNNEL